MIEVAESCVKSAALQSEPASRRWRSCLSWHAVPRIPLGQELVAPLPEATQAGREAIPAVAARTPEAAIKVRREAPPEAAARVPVVAVASPAAVVAAVAE
jgi:hypothetical protein